MPFDAILLRVHDEYYIRLSAARFPAPLTFKLLFEHVRDIQGQEACWFWHPHHGRGHSGGNGSST